MTGDSGLESGPPWFIPASVLDNPREQLFQAIFVPDAMLIEIDYLGCEFVAGIGVRYLPGGADMIEDSFTDHNIFVLQWCIGCSEISFGHGGHLPRRCLSF
jgi:hypothetical protein